MERPLSPHLQVYKPQLTSVLSITHRATGAFLSAGAVFVVYWLYALSQGPQSFATAQAIASSWLGKAILLALIFAVFFHLLNGVRHLLWDAGFCLELKPAYRTGWAVVALTLLATLYFGWLLFGAGT